MKRLFTLVLLLATSLFAAYGQKGLPAFGKVDKADLTMQDCDFDKGADAIKLIDYGKLYYDRGNAGFSDLMTVFEKRVRIKILNEKGLKYANVTIPFYARNGNENIVKFDASTYNLDEAGNIKETEVKKSSIYTKKINSFASEMIIAFPEAKAGSVIEYRYRMNRDSWHILDWYFQDRIPTRYSEYEIRVPALLRFTAQPSIVDKIDTREEVEKENINVNDGVVSTDILHKNFIMQHLPGIRNEPYMGSAKDYLQRIEFQLSQIDRGNGTVIDLRSKWSNIVDDFNKSPYFGKQLENPVPGAAGVISEAKKIADEQERTKYIFNAVRRTVNWNDEEDKYTDNGIVKAWDSKTGNSADINLLLVRLLTDAGLKAYPILLSTRENGLVNTYYPSAEQFDVVMAVVVINSKNIVLDAADKISNYRLTPEKIVNTNGFMLEGVNGHWITVSDLTHKYKVMAATQATISADGEMKGECFVNCKDYARRQRIEEWKKDKEKFKTDHFMLHGTGVIIDDLVINNADADSLQLEQKVKFSSKLNSSGNYSYFNINVFSDLDNNPFVADERVTDVDFGVLQDYTIFGNYTIPDGYTFDALPQNMSMIMPDTSIVFTRTMQADNNMLNVRISVEFQRTFYAAADYPEFKEFYKKLFAALNEQIVIKKKS